MNHTSADDSRSKCMSHKCNIRHENKKKDVEKCVKFYYVFKDVVSAKLFFFLFYE